MTKKRKSGLNTESIKPRLFYVIRNADESGFSGVGKVLDGVIFPNGKTVVCWRTMLNSVTVYDSFDVFKGLHIDQHPTNKTEIVFEGAKQ